jgi:hypothetical protein
MKNKPVCFLVRTDTGSQGLTAMDVQESLADELGYTRERINVKPVEFDQAIEAVAKFEFDRLERGDLRVHGGPLPWSKCEPALRDELLQWAKEILQAAEEAK